MKQIERYRGSLLGLATGDALGSPLEFHEPGTFRPIRDMVRGGAHNPEPGQWTDDTSMALCLAESLIKQNGFDPYDQLERYLRWFRKGYLSSTGESFGCGRIVGAALWHFERTREIYRGHTEPDTAGNGSIMRLAPVPLFYPANPAEVIEKSAESSLTTHGASTAVDACRYLGALIGGALNGASKQELLSDHYCPVPGYWEYKPLVAEIDEIASGSFKHKNPPEIRGTGYVVKSLEAALWAFHHGSTFKEGCLLAVNLGDDADTTGAVYGQLAGAFYGEQAIPESWRSRLTFRNLIESYADRLLEISSKMKRLYAPKLVIE
jgi:ADP-ribosyl-[dinitrogen reductase] hydrolase